MNPPSGAPANRGIMGDDDQGDAALVELFENVDHILPGFLIQIA